MGTYSQIGVGDGLFYSDDGGDSWTRTGLSGWRIKSICLSEQERRIYIGTGHSGSIFYSDDNGHSWTDITGDLPNEAKTVSSLITVDSTLYAAIRDKGVFRYDGTTHWEEVNYGLNSLKVTSLAASDSMLYVGTYDGKIFRARLIGK